MNTVILPDLLYGHIEFPTAFAQLFETRELQRLREVRISIPPQFLPTTPCASRFAHSLGVAYLAQRLSHANPDFAQHSLALQYAGLVHDVGHGPFSHCCEPVMKRVVGMDHEEAAYERLAGSGLEKLAINIGIDVTTAREYMNGPLCSGYPDLDNLDNTPRFGWSQGLCTLTYNPGRVAQSFRLVGGQWCLRQQTAPDIDGWASTRRDVYRFVYGPSHQAPYLMLRRVLELMAGDDKLPPWFFTMTDNKALEYLTRHGDSRTSWLIDKASHHEHFIPVYDEEVVATLAKQIDGHSLADEIASACHIPPEMVCANVQSKRGDKHRNVPFVDEAGKLLPLPPNGKVQYCRVVIYLAPEYQNHLPAIRECVRGQLNQALFALAS